MKKALLITVAAFSVPLTAQAGFEMDADVMPAPQKVVVAQPVPVALPAAASAPGAAVAAVPEGATLLSKYEAVTFVGTPDAEIARLDGFVTKVKLIDALQQISPKGWHAYIRNDPAKRFDKNRIVAWDGNRPWVDVLDSLALAQGFTVEVDWAKRNLYLSMNATDPVIKDKVVVADAPKKPEEPCWEIRYSDGRISNAVSRWTQQANWQLSWEMKDIPASFEGHFCGSFEQAIDTLVTSINKGGIPMRYDGKSGNKVLRIFSGAQ